MKRHLMYFLLMMVVSVESGMPDCVGPFGMQGKIALSILFAAAWSSILQGCYGATKQDVENHLEMGKKMLAAGQLADALSHYHAAVDGDPSNYLTYFRRATVLLAMGKSRSALSDLDKVIDLKPDFAAAWLQRGNIRLKQGEFDLAESDYKEVLKRDSSNADAHKQTETLTNLKYEKEAAKQHKERGETPTAIEIISKLLDSCPWDLELREMRADCYMSMGDSFKAVGDIKALSKLIPDNTGAMYKLSLIYYEVGQATESLTEIRECLKRDADHKECQPHYKKVKKLVSLQESMESAVREQRWPDCLSKANSILDLEKQVFTYRLQALGRLCHCQSEGGDFRESLAACKKVLDMDPNNYDALCDRANAYLKNEQYNEAINDYQQATNINGELNRAKEGINKAQKLKKQSEKRDYYKILGVKRNANKKEIMKAYRNLAMEWHPDKYEGEDKKMAEKKFIDIAAAKEVLTDPELRAKFDAGDDPLDAEQQAQNNNPWQQGFNPFGQGGFQFKFHFN